ncbi:MAG: urea ABC transporter permease subunit UrtC [Deltaproteobacteria bacterium]|jgi:urea transport system permease protein|nr:urea ABC transporter permease subunit UrtC [Deltaproteobacteria bacterium]
MRTSRPASAVFDGPTRIFFVLATVFTLAVSVGSLLPADSPFHVGALTTAVLGKYLCLAILAISIDLVWGYAGILSLGHGAFFALGGYAFGMYLMRQIGDKGVYVSTLPDFMVFIGWEKYPWYWLGTDMFWYALLLVFLAPGLLAFLFGRMAFGSRVSGVYFSIMSQALTYALMLAFFLNALGFGGNNGFTDFKSILGFDIRSRGMGTALFVISSGAMLLVYFVSRVIASSRLGLVLVAIRDNEARIRFAGYRVERVKLFVFTLSAMMAGLGGALYVPQTGIINPNTFAPLFSIEMVICVALGGRGRLYGAVIGAFAVNWLKSLLTGLFPDAWLFVFGLLFVVVTVFLPDGVAGLFGKIGSLFARGKPAGEESRGDLSPRDLSQGDAARTDDFGRKFEGKFEGKFKSGEAGENGIPDNAA